MDSTDFIFSASYPGWLNWPKVSYNRFMFFTSFPLPSYLSSSPKGKKWTLSFYLLFFSQTTNVTFPSACHPHLTSLPWFAQNLLCLSMPECTTPKVSDKIGSWILVFCFVLFFNSTHNQVFKVLHTLGSPISVSSGHSDLCSKSPFQVRLSLEWQSNSYSFHTQAQAFHPIQGELSSKPLLFSHPRIRDMFMEISLGDCMGAPKSSLHKWSMGHTRKPANKKANLCLKSSCFASWSQYNK